MTVTYPHQHLLSKRATSRTVSHFSDGPAGGPPEGFEPHPNPLPLHWGMPNHGFFPVDQLDISVLEYPFQKLKSLPVTNALLESLSVPQAGNSAPVTVRTKEEPSLIDLSQGLQYLQLEGIPVLRQFVREFIRRVHPPKSDDWEVILTLGAGDGLNKAAEALLDPEDVILVEEFTFLPFLNYVRERKAISVPVKLSLGGLPARGALDVEYLESLLDNWTELNPGLKKPKALYTIPSGQNPVGFSQPLETRKKVLQLAEKHDFLIIEDDPYGYLALPKYKPPQSIISLNNFLEIDEYLSEHLTPLYITLDSTGRVIRIETFSKVFAPGLRLGFIVAPSAVTKAIVGYANVSGKSPAGPSQIIVQNVIQQKFGGVDGYIAWILKVRATYAHRRDVLLHAFYESNAYKKGYLDVVDPEAGMFTAVLIKLPEDVDHKQKITLLNWKFQQFGVGVVPGANMAVDKEFSKERSNFYRVTFAPANNDDELREAGKRLSAAVDEFFSKGLEF